jgi:hypothetical protein
MIPKVEALLPVTIKAQMMVGYFCIESANIIKPSTMQIETAMYRIVNFNVFCILSSILLPDDFGQKSCLKIFLNRLHNFLGRFQPSIEHFLYYRQRITIIVKQANYYLHY